MTSMENPAVSDGCFYSSTALEVQRAWSIIRLKGNSHSVIGSLTWPGEIMACLLLKEPFISKRGVARQGSCQSAIKRAPHHLCLSLTSQDKGTPHTHRESEWELISQSL